MTFDLDLTLREKCL